MYAKYTRRASTSLPGEAFEAQQRARRLARRKHIAQETAEALVSAAGLMFILVCFASCLIASA
jgi:hypothetical protein